MNQRPGGDRDNRLYRYIELNILLHGRYLVFSGIKYNITLLQYTGW